MSSWDAIVYYMQAAEAGVELAAFNVAWLSDTSQVILVPCKLHVVPCTVLVLQDVQPAVAANLSCQYYSQSAQLNYSMSIIRLGDSYWYGEWAEENKQLAISSYSRAAHLGNGQV